MNKHLSQLIELSQIDKEIDSFAPRIEKINEKLSKALQKEREIQEKIDALSEEIKECEAKKRKNELHLAELSSKLEGISKKSSHVKTEKEMKALQLEEEIAKDQISFANDEIARLEKVADAKRADIKELEEKLAQAKQESIDAKERSLSELALIDEERKKVYMQKEKLVLGMSQKILSFYEKIRRWAKSSSVVPVRKHACYGCFMRLNDKVYADVVRGEEIVTCPHCGRILYLEKEEERESV